MPYVNIKITKEGATQLLVDVLGKSPASLVVVIDEIETDNGGIAGKSVTERQKGGVDKGYRLKKYKFNGF